AADELPDGQHGGAGADQPATSHRRRRWPRERPGERALLDGALDGGEEEREVEGLGEVVEGAVAHRLDGALAVAIGGGDDHRHLAMDTGAQLAQEVEAVAVAQPDVEQHAVDGLLREQLARLLEPAGGYRKITELLDGTLEALADAPLVLHDQHC